MSHARFIRTGGLSVSRALGMVAGVVLENLGRPEDYSCNSTYTCPSESIGDWFQDPMDTKSNAQVPYTK